MRIALIGDIALFGKNTIQNSDYKTVFGPIKEILDSCDYVVGNLETPLTLSTHVIGGKSAYIKGEPCDVEILKYLGVSHVSLANNHMFDFKSQGFEETVSVLEDVGIAWYGAKSRTATISKDGDSVVLLGYCCYSTNGMGMDVINPFIPLQVEKDLNNLSNSIPILSIHWGQEHVHYPNYDHVEVARKLCSKYRIVIHGHHPHVIQGIEEVKDSVIAYSLGNFCFDDVYTKKSREPLIKLSQDNQESMVFIVDIKANKIDGYEVVPFSFENAVYRIDLSILDRINEWSEFLKTDKEKYIYKRGSDLNTYLEKRKAKRDFEWYIKRMNIESFKQIVNMYLNKSKYSKYIKELTRTSD